MRGFQTYSRIGLGNWGLAFIDGCWDEEADPSSPSTPVMDLTGGKEKCACGLLTTEAHTPLKACGETAGVHQHCYVCIGTGRRHEYLCLNGVPQSTGAPLPKCSSEKFALDAQRVDDAISLHDPVGYLNDRVGFQLASKYDNTHAFMLKGGTPIDEMRLLNNLQPPPNWFPEHTPFHDRSAGRDDVCGGTTRGPDHECSGGQAPEARE